MKLSRFEFIHSDLHCPALRIQGINLEIGMSRKHKPLPPRHKRLTREFLISEETLYGFAFIAGYTAGGAPYGISFEEAKFPANADLSYFDASPAASDDDIPF